MIDTHCHLDMPAFDHDREAVWQRARAAGVRAAVIPGVSPATWSRTAALAIPGQRFVALGIHPQVLPEITDAEARAGLDSLADRVRALNGTAVAVGECGFDGAVDLDKAPLARQRAMFLAHVEIARALDLPLIVHVYRAHEAALDAMRATKLPRNPGVLHSYSGGATLLRAYLALGWHVSFAGAVTRPSARRPVESARAVPRERLLLETDAPDQPPTGAGEDRCEPAHVAITLARLSEIRGETQGELIEATTRNATDLFRLALAANGSSSTA